MAPDPSRPGIGAGRATALPGRGGGTAGNGRRVSPGSGVGGGAAPSAAAARGFTRAIGPWLHDPRSPGDGRIGLRSRASTVPSPPAARGTGGRPRRSVSPGPGVASGPRRRRRFMRQSGPMDSRRANQPSQVRPRPPSTARSELARTRPVSPSPTRLHHYRRIERRRGLPLVMKLFLAASVALLGAAIVWAGSGQVGPFVASVTRGLGGVVSQVSSVATSPAPSAVPDVGDAPTIVPPAQPYTNQETVDLTVNVPPAVAGKDGYTVRLYVTLPDAEADLVSEHPIGPTAAQLISGVELANGRNDFQASISGPGGETELSAVATFVLDTSKPKVTIISPKDGSQVTKPVATVKGKSQAASSIRLQNAANGAIATVEADKDGLWQAVLAVADGSNVIAVTATDLAGNANTAQLTLMKGSGRMTASLTGSGYRFRASKLPRRLALKVSVLGSDGVPLAGATTLFTVSVPGLEAIVSGEITTGADGTASFSTMIPSGATPGTGLATVLVSAEHEPNATDRQVLT